MEILKYLETHSLDDLTEELGIKIASNPKYPNLYCLNYCQIKSPKTNPIVQECRSLVLEYADDTFKIVSRSFDRFFNFGEAGAGDSDDINEMVACEKVDGSLVGLFYYNGEWLYRTRSMIMPEADMLINGLELSWKELIEETVIKPIDNFALDYQSTYIFEVVSPENRVVTRYAERKAYLLAKRNNEFGHYSASSMPCWEVPKMYSFETYKGCVAAAQNLRDLNEGYVMYNKLGQPVMKIKNPAYVAAHHLRGEGALTPRRVIDLIMINEHDEYLAIFPEDSKIFNKYILAYNDLNDTTDYVWNKFKSLLPNRKDFAMAVKDYSFNAFMFQKSNNNDLTFEEWFPTCNKNTRESLLKTIDIYRIV
jgi:hypothetical protein